MKSSHQAFQPNYAHLRNSTIFHRSHDRCHARGHKKGVNRCFIDIVEGSLDVQAGARFAIVASRFSVSTFRAASINIYA